MDIDNKIFRKNVKIVNWFILFVNDKVQIEISYGIKYEGIIYFEQNLEDIQELGFVVFENRIIFYFQLFFIKYFEVRKVLKG